MRLASLLPALPLLLLAGCASQQALDTRVDTLGSQLDTLKQTQAGTQQSLEARLARLEADQALLASRLRQAGTTHASQGELEALRTQVAAAEAAVAGLDDRLKAQSKHLAAVDGRFDVQGATIAQAQTTADEAVKIARDSRLVSGKVIDSLVLTEGMVLYSYEYPELMPEGRAALDRLLTGVKPQMPHVFIEIIGYSDDLSLGSRNRLIALERAEAVRRYLHEVGGIPLHRMATISYGDLKPLVTESTFEARRQNRRVMVQVLK
jgi:outer membrane protein OmpA-like peptidoglycan-associated protein